MYPMEKLRFSVFGPYSPVIKKIKSVDLLSLKKSN